MKLSTQGKQVILLAESSEESLLLDETLGKTVDGHGLIARVEGELRLSDGYGEHYLRLVETKYPEREDLAMLVIRLCRRLNKATAPKADIDLVEQALDYLDRKDLRTGSILREDS